MSENSFDAVVIGSGLGGLTAAALLAKAGRKVCVIERNHSVGGAASAFKQGVLTIEPALHQTADPHYQGDPKHWILKTLDLLDEFEWVPVSPFYSVKGGPIGDMVSRPEGFRLRPLAERCGSLSNSHRSHQANPPTVPLCQCTNRCGCFSAMRSRSRLARVLCPLSRLNLRIAQATNVMLKCLKTGYIAEGRTSHSRPPIPVGRDCAAGRYPASSGPFDCDSSTVARSPAWL